METLRERALAAHAEDQLVRAEIEKGAQAAGEELARKYFGEVPEGLRLRNSSGSLSAWWECEKCARRLSTHIYTRQEQLEQLGRLYADIDAHTCSAPPLEERLEEAAVSAMGILAHALEWPEDRVPDAADFLRLDAAAAVFCAWANVKGGE